MGGQTELKVQIKILNEKKMQRNLCNFHKHTQLVIGKYKAQTSRAWCQDCHTLILHSFISQLTTKPTQF